MSVSKKKIAASAALIALLGVGAATLTLDTVAEHEGLFLRLIATR